MRDVSGSSFSPTRRGKNWKLITDEFGNEGWWFRCSLCAGWREVIETVRPDAYCKACRAAYKRKHLKKKIYADPERHREFLENQRMRYRDKRDAEGFPAYPKRAAHRLRFREKDNYEVLPVGPIQDWIRIKLETAYSTPTELARACQLFDPEDKPDVRRISSILDPNKTTITFSSVDYILTREGSTFIWDLYPEEYASLVEAA